MWLQGKEGRDIMSGMCVEVGSLIGNLLSLREGKKWVMRLFEISQDLHG